MATCPTGSIKHYRWRLTVLFLLLVWSVILAACSPAPNAEDLQEDRKFANDPVTEQAVTPTVEPTDAAMPVAASPAVVVSPETLLRSRGAPDTLYTLSGGTLIALSVESGNGKPTPIPLPGDRSILDFDGSPSGDRVAVLTMSEKDSALFISFYRFTGEQIGDEHQIFTQDGELATPQFDDKAPPYTVSWSPQGTGALVAGFAELAQVDIEGVPERIELDPLNGRLQRAALSPEGTRVLLQTIREDGSQHVYVRDLEDERTREVKALRTGPTTELNQLEWLPDGSGLVYVRGQMVEGVALRGHVYVYRLSEEVPQLVATSGQGGQSATITDIAVAPDGDSVAYVISVRDVAGWAFHSMWVRSMDGDLSYQVPVDPEGVVTQLAWIDQGIAWEQRASMTDGSGGIMFLRWDRDATLLLPLASPGATPVSTPGATPVVRLAGTAGASPMATPVVRFAGTPAASPVATPIATPVE